MKNELTAIDIWKGEQGAKRAKKEQNIKMKNTFLCRQRVCSQPIFFSIQPVSSGSLEMFSAKVPADTCGVKLCLQG